MDNADRLGMKPTEVAQRLGVAETTVRGWEAGRSIAPDNVAALEALFGVPAPDQPAAVAGEGALLTAIRELVEELRLSRQEQARWNRGVEETLAAVLQGRTPEVPTGGPGPRHLASARR